MMEQILRDLTGGANHREHGSSINMHAVEVTTGEVTTVAGSVNEDEGGNADGVGDAAQIDGPSGIAISPDGGDGSCSVEPSCR